MKTRLFCAFCALAPLAIPAAYMITDPAATVVGTDTWSGTLTVRSMTFSGAGASSEWIDSRGRTFGFDTLGAFRSTEFHGLSIFFK